MDNFEFNKIFAAILVAGVTAWGGAFIAKELVHPHALSEDAVHIEGGAIEGAGVSGPVGPEPILALIAEADAEKGAKLSKACAACHSFDQGGPQKVGPNLYGLVGHKQGSVAGFDYSPAIAGLGGTWTYAELNKFMYKPKDYAPGTKMNYNGVKKPEQRAALIKWLGEQGGSLPMPTEAEIAAEQAELAPPAAIEDTEAEAPEAEAPATAH
ncbi:MAG: c-type cytochrome [Micavibrio sp.]|nr:c-type cytochrome [Micavibrio sp.]